MMRKEMIKLFDELDNAINLGLKSAFESDDITDIISAMDSESFEGIQSLLTAYKKAKEVNIELAERIDLMDDKLDRVIHMLETK